MSGGFQPQNPIENLSWRLKNVGKIVSVWLSVSKIKSFTDDELVRFAKDVTFGFESEGQVLIAALRFHHSGRRMTEPEMKDLAKQLAKDDAILEEILLWDMYFYGGRPPEAPTKRKGIWFWMVGQNASHQFEVGTKDGKRYRYSFGEDDDFRKVGAYIKEVPDWSGYYGHF